MSRPPAILPKDTVINGRYRIEKFVGAGGFASVYKAHDLMIERDVAIKVLNVHALGSGDEEHAVNLRRFRQEAKAAARIKHPAVVTIYDIGATSDFEQPFIVMEFLAGASLKQVLARDGAMEPARARRLLIPCLEALGEGHELGIIHKDMKPGNLFLTDPGDEDERLRLLDYGVARLQDESRAMTMGNQVVGTVAYLAPEYLVQQRVSPQLDVYQSGLILAEMLMGERVVLEDDVLGAANRHRFAQLEISAPLLAGPLAPVLAKALARDPDARYDDCDAFAAALKGVSLDGVPRIKAGTPRARLASVNPPPEETSDLDGDEVNLRATEEPGPTHPLAEPGRPSEPTEAIDAREIFARPGAPQETQGLDSRELPEPDGPDDDPWAGETLAMAMPAHVVAEYDARVAAEREARPTPAGRSRGVFGLVLAAGAAVLALVILVAVVLAVIFVFADPDPPKPKPVETLDLGELSAPPDGVVDAGRRPDRDAGLVRADGPQGGDRAADAGKVDRAADAVDGADAGGADGADGADGVDGGAAKALDVIIDGAPISVAVYDSAKRKLGYTPLTLRVPSDGVELTFKARGYQTRNLRVRAADGPRIVVSMKRRSGGTRPGIGIAQ